jgi:hypothetical protein
MPTLDDLSNQVGVPGGGAGPPFIGMPQETTSDLPDSIQTPPIPPPPSVTGVDQYSGLPSVLANPPGKSWHALTKPETAPASPGLDPSAFTPSYLHQMNQVDQGVPGAAKPMTKLGKLLYILQGVGTGAAVGSTQPTFGTGYLAAQQNQNEQQKHQLAIQQAQQNLTQVQTPWGMMPMQVAKLIFPASIAATSREKVAAGGEASKERIAAGQNLTKENVANINGMTRMAVAGASGVDVNQDLIDRYHLPQEFLGRRVHMSDISSFRNADARAIVPMMTDKGLVTVNKNTNLVTPATDEEGNTYASAALARPYQVEDPNNPGQTLIVPASKSFGMHGTGSASLKILLAGLKSQVPTKMGDQTISYTTMALHANLLRQAMQALNNGDMQMWNKIKNDFRTEFGYSGPLTAEAIADAYKGEVSSVINKGHITDTGSEKVAHTLDPTRQSPEQMDGVLAAYQALAESKMEMMNQQYQNVLRQAQVKNPPIPNKQNTPPPTPATHVLSKSAWQKSHPGQDWNTALAAANRQHYRVVP